MAWSSYKCGKPKCGNHFEANLGKCPNCGTPVSIGSRKAPPHNEKCEGCGELLDERSRKCLKCGFDGRVG